jgi:hypothetical protein
MMPIYVYALTNRAGAPFEAAGQQVDFIDIGDVFAAATTMAAMPKLSETALRAQHDIVGAIAARVEAILPARFGSLVARDELERIVFLRRDAIAEALALVAGREQMTLRVFGDPEPAGLDAPPPATTGTEYLAQRAAAGRMVPAAVRPLADAVRHLVKAERLVRGERGVMATLYHLVTRGDSAEYQQALDPLRAGFPGPGFIVSGPWPPFAFAPELWA